MRREIDVEIEDVFIELEMALKIDGSHRWESVDDETIDELIFIDVEDEDFYIEEVDIGYARIRYYGEPEELNEKLHGFNKRLIRKVEKLL